MAVGWRDMKPDPEDLLEHVIDHLCEEQAEAVAEWKDDVIRERAVVAIARAQGHGIEEAEAVTAFVSLMVLVGPEFDRQPSIAKVLGKKGIPAAERLRALFVETREEDWEEAAGLGGWPE